MAGINKDRMIGDHFLSVVSDDSKFQDREVVRKKSKSFAFPPPCREQSSDRLSGENRDMRYSLTWRLDPVVFRAEVWHSHAI